MRAVQVKPECYQQALELADALERDDAPRMLEHSRVRHAIADYLERELVPINASEYGRLAWKLRDARPIAAYGVDTYDVDEPRREKWANRAGLVKLCPSDARCEQQRASRLYGRRLAELDAQGYVLRSAVFTLPNFPQWHLAAGLDTIFERFKQTVLYAKTNGTVARSIHDRKRKFPDLVGAWACLESPLSGKFVDGDRLNAWNVHLNILLVFKPSDGPYGRPDYEPIHDAWGAGIRWRVVPQGDHDAMRHAILELVKYPLQTVATKSAKDRRRKFDRNGAELTPAPPMIEWPAECFDEWWRAHKGFRRARSWGLLYAGAFPDDDTRSDNGVDWLGVIRVSPAGISVSRPSLSTIDADRDAQRRTRTHSLMLGYDPGYRATIERRERDTLARAATAAALEAARGRLFLIQGNKSAGLDARANVEKSAPRAKNRPPDTG